MNKIFFLAQSFSQSLNFSLSFILFVSVNFYTINIYADEESVYVEIAKFRTYPSGADECDLKVQPLLNNSQDKKIKLHSQEAAQEVMPAAIQDEASEGF